MDRKAIATADQSLSGSQRWYVPELLRDRGRRFAACLAPACSALSEDCYDRAGELAREQGSLFWELRIAVSLARLRVGQGRGDEARNILEPVYDDRFTEGFATAGLQA